MLAIAVGTPFDIQFPVVVTTGATVLVSDCYQYYVAKLGAVN